MTSAEETQDSHKPGGELRPLQTCLRMVLKEDALKDSPSSMLQTQASLGLTFLILRVKPSNLPPEDLREACRAMVACLSPSQPSPTPGTCPAEQAWELLADSRCPLFTAVQKSLYGTDL